MFRYKTGWIKDEKKTAIIIATKHKKFKCNGHTELIT